jgi:cyclopropane-fatty-acyl-phospholipid synthase
LFSAFLDETMCYSSAIFPTSADGSVIADEDALSEAQRRKIDELLDLADVHSGTRVLEIGTGWGELAVRAAQRGALVQAVTNMAEHVAYARSRASQGNVADRVRVDLRDYRELSADEGSFDAIVSVEMIEAVGRSYWPTFFQTLERLLAPQGRIGMQAMTMRHDRMLKTSTTYTWIDKYIFPGGLIPSLDAIEQTLARHTSLRVLDRRSYGDHYRATLSLWRTRFNRNWPDVAALGFNEVLRRTWNFYLAYCEAGFAAGYLDVHQFLIGRLGGIGGDDQPGPPVRGAGSRIFGAPTAASPGCCAAGPTASRAGPPAGYVIANVEDHQDRRVTLPPVPSRSGSCRMSVASSRAIALMLCPAGSAASAQPCHSSGSLVGAVSLRVRRRPAPRQSCRRRSSKQGSR